MPKADANSTTPSPGHDHLEDVFCNGLRHAVALRFLATFLMLRDKAAPPVIPNMPSALDVCELYDSTVGDHLGEQAGSARRAEAMTKFALAIVAWEGFGPVLDGIVPTSAEADRMHATTALTAVAEYLWPLSQDEYIAAVRRRPGEAA